MAHKKAGGSSRNGRDSAGRRLGVKLYGGQQAVAGNIIVRGAAPPGGPARTSAWAATDTLFALTDGQVSFRKGLKGRTYISVLPANIEGRVNRF
ncbi:MAG: 50S ribosomal protein L27 [Paracoccus sp. (in: a-proteobacteria)]